MIRLLSELLPSDRARLRRTSFASFMGRGGEAFLEWAADGADEDSWLAETARRELERRARLEAES